MNVAISGGKVEEELIMIWTYDEVLRANKGEETFMYGSCQI